MTRIFFAFSLILYLALPCAQAQDTIAKRQIELEFEEVPKASKYEIELTSKLSKKTTTFVMKKPIWKATIRPAEYSLRMRSYDSRGVPGAWSESTPFLVKLPGVELIQPKNLQLIKTGQPEHYDTEISWTQIKGTDQYRLEVWGEGFDKVTEMHSKNKVIMKLPVAKKYYFQATPISKMGEEGETQEKPNEFTLVGQKLDTPKIDKPEDIWPEKIKWQTPEFAEHYAYVLQRQENKKWIKVTSGAKYVGNEVIIPLDYPGGLYRLNVKAFATNREPSNADRIDFQVAHGDRSPAAVANSKLRESLEKPTDWYFIGSWMSTSISYSDGAGGTNFGDNPMGGSGRIGLGYVHPTHNHGFLLLGDLSGILAQESSDGDSGKLVTYKSLEGHYLKKYTVGRSLLRPSTGLAYKELFDVKQTQTGISSGSPVYKFEYNLISFLAPHIGIDFWHPLSSRIGVQLNARAFINMMEVSTPESGSQNVGDMSTLLGILASYKIKSNVMGLVGYANRTDRVSFTSQGTKQNVEISGHYLNLILEWGF